MKNSNQLASDLIALLYSPSRPSHDPHVGRMIRVGSRDSEILKYPRAVTCSRIHSYVHVGLYQQRLHLHLKEFVRFLNKNISHILKL